MTQESSAGTPTIPYCTCTISPPGLCPEVGWRWRSPLAAYLSCFLDERGDSGEEHLTKALDTPRRRDYMSLVRPWTRSRTNITWLVYIYLQQIRSRWEIHQRFPPNVCLWRAAGSLFLSGANRTDHSPTSATAVQSMCQTHVGDMAVEGNIQRSTLIDTGQLRLPLSNDTILLSLMKTFRLNELDHHVHTIHVRRWKSRWRHRGTGIGTSSKQSSCIRDGHLIELDVTNTGSSIRYGIRGASR